MSTDSGEYCQTCSSTRTYWTLTSVDGDVWDCRSCGHQWTVEVGETIKERHGDGRGGITPGKSVDLVREALSGSPPLTRGKQTS